MSVDGAVQWMLTPISGAVTHEVDVWVMWHARLMVLAWAILLPLGALAARYYKVMPTQEWPLELDNRVWWHAHRTLQYGGIACMLIGVALVCNTPNSVNELVSWHRIFGYSVVGLGVLQVLSAWLRGSKGGPNEPQMRGDHYDMTPHRLRFEWLHKGGGWLAIVLAVVTIVLGLIAADAPRWMALVLLLWWSALIVLAGYLQRQGRNISTYHAIWGLDTQHPGNQTTAADLRPHQESV